MTITALTNLTEIKRSLPLRWETPESWTCLVLENLSHFLADHASCERKAHAAALMLANKFPEHPELQDRMIGLAREELEHFHQVFRILKSRGIAVASDDIDQYVKRLMTFVRHPRSEHLLDRLLVAAMIEARSCERFCLFAEAITESDLKSFYTDFAKAESAHAPLFVQTAEIYYPKDLVRSRMDFWLDREAEICSTSKLRAGVH